MLTGLKPFSGDSVTTIIYRILNEYPKQPQFVNEAIPAELGAVLMRALEKEPSRRYQTGLQFAHALQANSEAVVNASMAMAATMPVPIIRPGAFVPAAEPGGSTTAKTHRPATSEERPRPGAAPAVEPAVEAASAKPQRNARPAVATAAQQRVAGRRFPTAFIFLGLIALVLFFPVTGNKSDGWGAGGADGLPPFQQTASIVAGMPAGPGSGAAGGPGAGAANRNGTAEAAAGLPPIAVPGGVETVTRTIRSDPPGARIYVDDVEVPGGEVTIPATDTAVHTVVAENDCFIEKKEVRLDKDKPIVIALETPKVTQVPVDSEPAGATILLDGKPSGRVTPAELTLDACGAHEVKLSLDGYKSASSALSGKDGSLTLRLAPIPKGFVKVTASYPVEVYEKGRKVGLGGQPIRLTSGRHELIVRNDGLFVDKKITVNVPEDRTITTDAALPAVGRLTVLTSPGNCTISLNGRDIGAPPINDLQVAAGVYKVRAVYVPTGESKEATITVPADGSARVPFKFTP